MQKWKLTISKKPLIYSGNMHEAIKQICKDYNIDPLKGLPEGWKVTHIQKGTHKRAEQGNLFKKPQEQLTL